MRIFLNKVNKKAIILALLMLILSATIILFLIPKKVICTLSIGITKETVNASFRANKLKSVKVTTTASYNNKKEAEAEMKLQKIGINAIKNYGYKVNSRIDNNIIVIEYSGKVKNIINNIYTKNIKINDFKKNMYDKHYECK